MHSTKTIIKIQFFFTEMKIKQKQKMSKILKNLPLSKVDFPPDRAPKGSVPVGVRPFNVSTLSLSSRSVVKTLAILPIALILLRIISLRAATPILILIFCLNLVMILD
jgi:hypothetical protein